MEKEIQEILGRFKSHEDNTFQTVQALKQLYELQIKPIGKEFLFEEKAIKMKDGDTAVWTDGLALSSDTEPHCAFSLINNNWYRVTVQQIPKPTKLNT